MEAKRSLSSSLAAVIIVVAMSVFATPARADDVDPAFVYTTPAHPVYLRMAVEEIGLLGLGLLQYASTKSNEADWDVRADWPGVRSKVLWDAASFDDNRFDTNWLTHPAAGFLYYSTARGNRLGILPSFGVTVMASAFWEEIGELREQVALNDMVVTPISAVPLGESALQLGAFLHRGRRTPALVALGWLFAPWKSAHDAIDGVTPQGAYVVDDLGLPADVWHRFSIGGSGGRTAQRRGTQAYDVRGFFESELVTIPGYRRDGKRSVFFGSGEVTSTRFQLGASEGEIVDLAFAATTLPVGFYWQDVDAGADGRLRGTEVLAGFHVSAEYMLHDYDRDRRREGDRLALVSAGGSVEQIVHAAGLTVRGRLQILGDFAGVDAYALPEYLRAQGDARLTSVLRHQRYYHAYGATVRPQLDLALSAFDAGADVRFDGFRSIDHVDVEGALEDEAPAADRRISARAWLGVKPWQHLRLFAAGERNERSGSVAAVHAARSEVGVHVGAELVF
jgi:hypothetical protein